jgi:hypothetical protein
LNNLLNVESKNREETEQAIYDMLRDVVGRVKTEMEQERNNREATEENLLSLSSSDKPGACVVGKIANSLDEETRQAFFAVMASTASSNSIANTLREEGLVVARSTVVQKRACFTEGGSHMCACFPGLYTGEAK